MKIDKHFQDKMKSSVSFTQSFQTTYHNVSQLRQWLNETDKDLITNEDILHWLEDTNNNV